MYKYIITYKATGVLGSWLNHTICDDFDAMVKEFFKLKKQTTNIRVFKCYEVDVVNSTTFNGVEVKEPTNDKETIHQ